MKKPPDTSSNIKKFLIPKLRRYSLYWPGRSEAIKLARLERGEYKCATCEKTFGRTEIHVDHIKPVINVKDKTIDFSWDKYINSLFCDVSNLQVLCVSCHQAKTDIENNIRKINKKKKK